MKIIIICFILGIILASISFVVYKLLSASLQRERKIAEETMKMANGKELIHKRIQYNSKRISILSICFCLGLALFLFIIIIITLLIKKNVSPELVAL
jgi:uncharacterized protein YneF (UPF0154 family)